MDIIAIRRDGGAEEFQRQYHALPRSPRALEISISGDETVYVTVGAGASPYYRHSPWKVATVIGSYSTAGFVYWRFIGMHKITSRRSL